jgi:hypothetical protein
LRYVRRLLKRADYGNLLGVELSGGLDTSIIIEFLIRWQIPFALIGMRTDRYEFRTERTIQEYYAQRCPTVRMYSGKDIPAFSRLDEVPPHPYPTMFSLNFSQSQKKAETCRDIGVTTLLSGDAGDRLLSFPTPQLSSNGRTPVNWSYWNLAQTIWDDQYIFSPKGVRFISGLASGRIPALVLQLRAGIHAVPRAGAGGGRERQRLSSMVCASGRRRAADALVRLRLARDHLDRNFASCADWRQHTQQRAAQPCNSPLCPTCYQPSMLIAYHACGVSRIKVLPNHFHHRPTKQSPGCGSHFHDHRLGVVLERKQASCHITVNGVKPHEPHKQALTIQS